MSFLKIQKDAIVRNIPLIHNESATTFVRIGGIKVELTSNSQEGGILPRPKYVSPQGTVYYIKEAPNIFEGVLRFIATPPPSTPPVSGERGTLKAIVQLGQYASQLSFTTIIDPPPGTIYAGSSSISDAPPFRNMKISLPTSPGRPEYFDTTVSVTTNSGGYASLSNNSNLLEDWPESYGWVDMNILVRIEY